MLPSDMRHIKYRGLTKYMHTYDDMDQHVDVII